MSNMRLLCITLLFSSAYLFPAETENVKMLPSNGSHQEVEIPPLLLEKVTRSSSEEYLERVTPRSQSERDHFPLNPKTSPNQKVRDLLAAFS